MELFDHRGMVAVVTGSSHGIGRAIGEGLAEAGSRVVFSSRDVETCASRARGVNERWGEERAIAIKCDMGARDEIRGLIEETLDHWGRSTRLSATHW